MSGARYQYRRTTVSGHLSARPLARRHWTSLPRVPVAPIQRGSKDAANGRLVRLNENPLLSFLGAYQAFRIRHSVNKRSSCSDG